jgi:hypothetical protein
MDGSGTDDRGHLPRSAALGLLLAAVLIAGVIAGCSSKKSEVGTGDTTTTATEDEKDTTKDTKRDRDRTTTTGSGGSSGTAIGDEADEQVVDTTWTENAARFRGRDGLKVAYQCSPNGTFGSVWGTETYTDDSSVCTAAVHAGLITQAAGGRVVIEIEPGEDAYRGSVANGVTSSDYGPWSGSYTFED